MQTNNVFISLNPEETEAGLRKMDNALSVRLILTVGPYRPGARNHTEDKKLNRAGKRDRKQASEH